MGDLRARVGAIIGPARSGTTWAGTLIDSSPDVIYRFEPFRRMSPVSPDFRRWFAELKQERFTESDISSLYSALRHAHPFTSKPPFFPLKAYAQRTFARQLMWPVAKVVPGVAGIYDLAYTPQSDAPVIFKEVTFIKPLKNLMERTSMAAAYLVRHPCATVLSEIRGQQGGMMPTGRQAHLREILERYSPDLAAQYKDVVDGTDIFQRIALLWRCEVEVCVPLVAASGNGLLVSYERLATDTESQTRRIFSHFGLVYGEQTQGYIDYLHGLESSSVAPTKRTGWGKKYFSIHRNPANEHDAWKRRISREDRDKIYRVLRTSTVFEQCAELGRWD